MAPDFADLGVFASAVIDAHKCRCKCCGINPFESYHHIRSRVKERTIAVRLSIFPETIGLTFHGNFRLNDLINDGSAQAKLTEAKDRTMRERNNVMLGSYWFQGNVEESR